MLKLFSAFDFTTEPSKACSVTKRSFIHTCTCMTLQLYKRIQVDGEEYKLEFYLGGDLKVHVPALIVYMHKSCMSSSSF